ncbi:hypothetical protein OU997_07955 [Pseudomonas sp. SL4(2022)]|uniref:hypothetical protein n=1 Tax=Pseudomonas sp. SL4(2022) TaxID=2994661 RepID=UPI00226F22C6|nr:hypothetical protein [Pseudomonas sp. SL4(2022)]WAC46082.1 hypothetical protein OU997_07955 [Pseudomonas sp. SL4(2022)]
MDVASHYGVQVIAQQSVDKSVHTSRRLIVGSMFDLLSNFLRSPAQQVAQLLVIWRTVGLNSGFKILQDTDL